MTAGEISFKPIGIIHTPFKEPEGTPIQPKAGEGVEGYVEIFPEYVDGLKDLDGFSHIILIYYFHLSRPYRLKVTPFMDDQERGLFATRAPSRPNPIGISVVRLMSIEKDKIFIRDIDIVDNTPLLDIKPYVPAFDEPGEIRIGWLQSRVDKLKKTKDDGRFT